MGGVGGALAATTMSSVDRHGLLVAVSIVSSALVAGWMGRVLERDTTDAHPVARVLLAIPATAVGGMVNGAIVGTIAVPVLGTVLGAFIGVLYSFAFMPATTLVVCAAQAAADTSPAGALAGRARWVVVAAAIAAGASMVAASFAPVLLVGAWLVLVALVVSDGAAAVLLLGSPMSRGERWRVRAALGVELVAVAAALAFGLWGR